MNATPITSLDSVEFLRTVRFFDELDDSTREAVAEHLKWRRYKRGVEIFPYRASSDEVYFIASGCVRVTMYSIQGREVFFEDLTVGNMFGELSAIDHLPRTATVITREASVIGAMRGVDCNNLLLKHPTFAVAILKRMASMVRSLVNRAYQDRVLDVKDRIRAELLRLARENSADGEMAIVRNFPTHNDLANRVNTHREAVTRELAALARLGIIEQKHRVLKIEEISRLAALLPEDL